MHGSNKNAYKTLVRKSEGKRPFRKSRNRWEDNNKMDLKQDMRLWTGLIWLGIGTMGSNESSSSIEGRKFLDQVSAY
jgi:hypothetical protein